VGSPSKSVISGPSNSETLLTTSASRWLPNVRKLLTAAQWETVFFGCGALENIILPSRQSADGFRKFRRFRILRSYLIASNPAAGRFISPANA
jgi:hypothetical protein